MKKYYLLIGAAVFLGMLWLAAARLALFQKPVAPGAVVSRDENAAASIAAAPYEIEEVAGGLEVPWSIVFTSPTRILIAERPGRIRVIENGKLNPEPLLIFPEVSNQSEEGLMGLALHPEYAANRLIYASLAYGRNQGMFVKIVRLRDEGDKLAVDKVILDKIPAAQYHAGSALAFGPLGRLYISTGDATNKDLAQDLSSLAGKILRLNPDGTIPADNPFPGSPVWSYGHRNPQGLAWSESGEMYATEHGPSVFDGPAGGDEVNHIVKGGNYGWPLVSHEKKREGTIAPLALFTPAEAPASGMFYTGAALPQFKGSFFFGALRGAGLIRMAFDPGNPDQFMVYEKLQEVQFGRIRAVAEGPDGAIYFSTSNRDGRGRPAANDDRIFRIKAKNTPLRD